MIPLICGQGKPLRVGQPALAGRKMFMDRVGPIYDLLVSLLAFNLCCVPKISPMLGCVHHRTYNWHSPGD